MCKKIFTLLLGLFFCSSTAFAANGVGVGAEHYCKAPESFGRANYTCKAAQACAATESDLSAISAPSYSNARSQALKLCKTQCAKKATCPAKDDEDGDKKPCSKKENYESCKLSCVAANTPKILQADSAASNAFIGRYVNECEYSRQKKGCEAQEASKYCKFAKDFQNLVKKGKWPYPPRDQASAAQAKKYFDITKRLVRKRCSDLSVEQTQYESNLTEATQKCGKNFGCELEYDKLSKGSLFDALNLSLASETPYKEMKCEEEKRFECQPTDCKLGRDDTASAENGDCMCDQYCDTVNDCCENYVEVCQDPFA